MQQFVIRLARVGLCLLALVGCTSATPGPRTWIDRPLDGTTALLAPLTLMAHASDIDGVASIEFSVDGKQVSAQGAGGAKLGQAIYEWTPPGPGIYLVEVRAIDSGGNPGSTDFSSVTISSEASQPPVTEPPLELPATTEPAVTEEVVVTTEPPTEPPLVLTTPPPVIVTTAPPAAILTQPPIIVTTAPPAAILTQPPVIVTTAPPAPDTSKPVVTSSAANPATILKAGDSCGGKKNISTSTIKATDNGEIASVTAGWALQDPEGNWAQSGFLTYSAIDSVTFQVTVGPVVTDGIIYISGTVSDEAGNVASFSQQITVQACID